MASLNYGFDTYDDGGSYGGSSLASELIGIGGSLANTAILANANPTNAAIITGQGVATPTLTTSGVPTVASARISGMGLLVVAIVGVALFFAVRR